MNRSATGQHPADHGEDHEADKAEEQRDQQQREGRLHEQRDESLEADVEVDNGHALSRQIKRYGLVHGLSPSRWLTVPLIVLLAACTHIAPLAIASHVSNPTDGGQSDTTTDFLGAGITATFGSVSIDAALGRKSLDCKAFVDCESSPGGLATLRWTPAKGAR